MKIRGLLIIIVLFTGFEAWAWWRHLRDGAASAAFADQSLLDVRQIDRARRIVIREKPQSKTVQKEEGFEVRLIVEKDTPIREAVLERREGNRWTVVSRYGLEADTSWLGQTLRDLVQARIVRHVTRDPKLMSDLALDLGQIRLEDAEGRVIRRLDFGRKDGGEIYQFVRIDEADAFIVKHETEIVGDPLAWVAGRVLTFDVTDVRDLEVSSTEKAGEVMRWSRAAKGAPFQNELAQAMAGSPSEFEQRLARTLSEPLVLAVDAGAATVDAARSNIVAMVKVTLFDGRTYSIRYGAVPSGHPNISEITPYDAESLVFAFFECSDPQDLCLRQSLRAGLGYNRSSTLGRLMIDATASAGSSGSAEHSRRVARGDETP